jgi:hypothetical protein
MKTNIRRLFRYLFALFVLVVLFALLALPALAQTNDAPAAGLNDATQAAVGAFIVGFATKYPIVATILFWITTLKLCFKPVMLVIEAVVAATPSEQDDAKLRAFEAGAVYRWLVWGLDWLTGIKTPNALKAGTTNPIVKT